jgi:hypothetical protein
MKADIRHTGSLEDYSLIVAAGTTYFDFALPACLAFTSLGHPSGVVDSRVQEILQN